MKKLWNVSKCYRKYRPQCDWNESCAVKDVMMQKSDHQHFFYLFFQKEAIFKHYIIQLRKKKRRYQFNHVGKGHETTATFIVCMF